ncbi:lactonase family protein [Sporobolomyces koalae]|uniref:lactonase family protein n=1 Tax=Sporobolomyces koalae TaxID=500713 RepID=UPI00318223B2
MSLSSCIPSTSLTASQTCGRLHYLLSGTFNTVFLYLLAFSPYTNPPTLRVHDRIRAEGPHQYLALSEERDTAYATTWAQPPSLSSWSVLDRGQGGISRLNSVPISATGSYLAVLPSHWQSSLELDMPRVYQAGGPVAQTFSLANTGALQDRLQEVIYLDGGEAELWDPATDRTRVALRYGSHAIDLDPNYKRAYVPHVGRDSIYAYAVELDGTLRQLAEVPSFGNRGHEGPRHSIPSRDGRKLYVVTEHTSYLDVYDVIGSMPYLAHSQRLSIIPSSLDPSRALYRGDTLRLSLDDTRIYVTTRGKTSAEKGFISVWRVEPDGSIADDSTSSTEERGYGALHRFETATSGGKANAIEVFPFSSAEQREGRDWLVLTDDEEGWVSILEWNDPACQLTEIARVQLGRQEGAVEEEAGTGASHAVWLS